MPVALLLQKYIKSLARGAKKLDSWIELVWLEDLLIARAQSAFLVHWFGSRLPINNLYLRVAIQNLNALRRRYREVGARVRPRSTGLNLTEPLAGMAGSLVGMILSPTGAILAGYTLIRFLWRSAGRLAAGLGGLIMGPLATALGAIAGLLLLPVGFIFGIVGGAFSRGVLLEGYDLLGAIAELLVAVTGFMNQLMGPRENIRNPLVRQILELFDRVAVLFLQIFTVFVVLVTRIAPLILPLAHQAVAFRNLFQSVFILVRQMLKEYLMLEEIFSDLFAPLRGTRATERSPLYKISTVIDVIMSLLPAVLPHLIRLMDTATGIMRESVQRALPQLLSWLVRAVLVILPAIINHWTVRGITAGIRQVQVIQSAIPGATGSSGSSSTLRTMLGVGAQINPVPLPSLPSLPDITRIISRAGGPPPLSPSSGSIRTIRDLIPGEWVGTPFRLDEQARRAAESMRQRPTSVFASERERLRQAQGQDPAGALQDIQKQEMQYRNILTTVVGRILPPEIRVYMPQLQSMFQSVDQHLYQQTSESGETQLPVLELADNGRLRPVVHRLVVRSRGGDREAVGAFKDQLVRILTGQQYMALAGT